MENAIELDSHLEKLIYAQGYEPGLAKSLAGELLPIYASWESKAGTNNLSAVVPGKRLVVRNDDLRLFDAAVAAVLSAASAGFFVPPGVASTSIVSAITGILAGCLQTGRQLLRKGVILTPEQFELISLLRSCISGRDTPTRAPTSMMDFCQNTYTNLTR